MYRYVLFDLDGTLTDPKEGICKSVQHALKCAGIDPPPVDELTAFIGPPLSDSFREFYGMDEKAVEKAVADYRERFSDVGWKENIPYDGITELLKHCRQKGVYLAVASSKPQVFVERILKHFGMRKYFNVVVGSGLDGSLGTKSEVVREALRQLYRLGGRKQSEKEKKMLTAMVGDRKYDVEGARTEEIEAIGVSYGYQQPGELAEAGADAIAKDVGELEELLLGGKSEKKVIPRAVPDHSLARALYMLMPLILYYLLRIGLLAGMQAGIKGFGSGADVPEADYTWPVALMTGLTALGLWLIYRGSEPMRMGKKKSSAGRAVGYIMPVVLGALLALGLNILAAFITGFLSESVREALIIPDTPRSSGYLAGLILYGILSPLAEELLFRWLLLNRIGRVFDTRLAIFLSALFFGIYHGNVMQGCYAFLMGLALALICVCAESLPAAFLFHASANIVIYTAAFLPAAFRRIAERLPMGLLYLGLGICGMIFFVKRNNAPQAGEKKR